MARKVGHILHDVLAAIEGIEQALVGKILADLEREWLLRHGIQRGIEIISEAARRIPPELRQLRTEISWPSIIAIGNVLRHEYQNVSDTVIWRAVTDDLPALKLAILAIRDQLHE